MIPGATEGPPESQRTGSSATSPGRRASSWPRSRLRSAGQAPVNTAAVCIAKVELHLHLDISISYRVASILAPGISRSEYRRRLQGPSRRRGLSEFLAATDRQVALLQSAKSLRLVTSPEEAVSAVVEAAVTAGRRHAVGIGVILTALRHFSTEESLETAKLVVRFRQDGVVAFDLGGDEAPFPLAPHLSAFEHVRDAGLPYTVHGGEGAGSGSVRQVQHQLAPPRIGHGVRSVEDPAVVESLIQERTHLEMSPTSNLQQDLYPSMRSHPVGLLYRRGAKLSVSTDSRTATATTLTDEYASLSRAFGWTIDDVAAVMLWQQARFSPLNASATTCACGFSSRHSNGANQKRNAITVECPLARS